MEISEDFSKFSINQSQRLPSLRSLQIEKLPTQAQTNTCDSSTSEKTTSSDDTIKDLPEKSVVEEQFCKLLDDLGLKDDVKIKIISNYNLERKWELIKMNNNTKAVDTPFDVKKFITFISNASISDLSGFELAKLRKKLTYQATSALISKLVEEGLLDEMEKITKKLFQGTFIGSRKKWEIQLEILKLLDIILRSQEQAGNILKKKILVYTKKLILDYHLDKETQLILNQREYPKSIFETSSFCAPLENRILFFKILTNLLKIVDDVVSVFDGSENEVTVSSADQNVTKEEYLNLFDAVFDDSMYNGENLLDLFEKENKFIFQSLFLELKYCVFERHKNLSGGDSKSNYIFNSLADGTYRWEKIIQARTKKYKTAEANEYIKMKLLQNPQVNTLNETYNQELVQIEFLKKHLDANQSNINQIPRCDTAKMPNNKLSIKVDSALNFFGACPSSSSTSNSNNLVENFDDNSSSSVKSESMNRNNRENSFAK